MYLSVRYSKTLAILSCNTRIHFRNPCGCWLIPDKCAGMIIIASNIDIINMMMTMTGKSRYVLPSIPGKKSNGINAIIVVKHEKRTGVETSLSPRIAAIMPLCPLWRRT